MTSLTVLTTLLFSYLFIYAFIYLLLSLLLLMVVVLLVLLLVVVVVVGVVVAAAAVVVVVVVVVVAAVMRYSSCFHQIITWRIQPLTPVDFFLDDKSLEEHFGKQIPCVYNKTWIKQPLKRRPKNSFQDRLLLNACQRHCIIPQGNIWNTLTCIEQLSVLKIFILSIMGGSIRKVYINWV